MNKNNKEKDCSDCAKSSIYYVLLEQGRVLKTQVLSPNAQDGRVFLCLSKGILSPFVAEIYPFEVSWALTEQTDEHAAWEEALHKTKNYFDNIISSIK